MSKTSEGGSKLLSDNGSKIMAIDSALILLKFKNQTVKDQYKDHALITNQGDPH